MQSLRAAGTRTQRRGWRERGGGKTTCKKQVGWQGAASIRRCHYVVTSGGEPDPHRGPFFHAARLDVRGVAADDSEEFHVRRLTPYHRDRDPTGALGAATVTPLDEFPVRDIVAHKPESPQPLDGECSCDRGHLRWRVSWLGLGAGNDTWEPASLLERVEQFQTYNTTHRLAARARAQAKCERAHPLRAL